MTPRAFLDLLWQYKPEEQHILVWTLQDKRSHWFQDVGKAAEFVTRASASMDVYVGVALSKDDHGPTRRCKSEEVSGLCGIGIDLDLKSDAHGNKPLPATIADALSIVPQELPPTIVIATGNGAHAWWLLKEPQMFESSQERAEGARVVARWHTMLRLRAAAKGWVYDRLSDLARVLRIAGTLNHKDPAHPKAVEIHSRSERFYNLSDFEEFLDDAAVPDPDEEDRAACEWKERFADTPLRVDPRAIIPQEKLDAWMDAGNSDARTVLRFRNTWNRQRHDLADQSGSGYDLALACFGLEAGLTEQGIVDLICHHRRVHNLRARTRLDYYQRTIAKAQRKTGVSEAVAATAGASLSRTGQGAPRGAHGATEGQEATSTSSAPVTAPSAEDQKALLCIEISRRLDTDIVRFVMIEGKDPQYRIELGSGKKLEFTSYSKFIDQQCVLAAIGAATKRVLVKMKPPLWRETAQMMLNACYEEDGTEETEWEGATRMYLYSYLKETSFIPCIEEQRLQDQRKPMLIDGKITICASDFQTYVNKTTFQNLSVKAITGMLSAIGATGGKRMRGTGYKEQSRWVLPVAEFDPAEYPQHEGGAPNGR